MWKKKKKKKNLRDLEIYFSYFNEEVMDCKFCWLDPVQSVMSRHYLSCSRANIISVHANFMQIIHYCMARLMYVVEGSLHMMESMTWSQCGLWLATVTTPRSSEWRDHQVTEWPACRRKHFVIHMIMIMIMTRRGETVRYLWKVKYLPMFDDYQVPSDVSNLGLDLVFI